MGNTYRFSTREEENEALAKLSPLASEHGLSVQILPSDIMSRGVQGDEGTYTRVILLSGKNPGWKVLEELSTKMTNLVPMNRVLFEDEDLLGGK